MNDEALVLVHVHSYNDGGRIEDKVIEVLEEFTGTTYELPEGDRTSYGKDEGLYDHTLKDKGHGKPRPEDAANLVRKHGKVSLGGGFVKGCMWNAYNSLRDMKDALKGTRDGLTEDTEIKVVPEISYGGRFDPSNLDDISNFGEIFTLKEVKDRDLEDLPAKVSEYFESGNVESIL